MMVADFVFRKQIEWLVDNTGVCSDFKDVAHKIWFSYLSHYMPDLKEGLERELGGNQQWHLAFPQADLPALLNCSRRELKHSLSSLQQQAPDQGMDENGRKISRLWRDFGSMNSRQVMYDFCYFRPTAVVLIAIIGIALYVCQEEILVSDLMRWARLLKLPLVDMLPYKGSATPAELRGVLEKSRTLYSVAQYTLIERTIVWVACTLLDGHIDKLPALPIAPLIQRFIEELNLPLDMIPFVLGLSERINSGTYRMESISICRAPKATPRRSMNVESHVMCVIFYALRLLFVLDGSTEYVISDATDRMQGIMPNVQLFNFRVWFHHLMHRRLLLFKHTMLSRKSHSAMAYCDFIQANLISRSVSSAKILASDRKTKGRKKLYQELQLSWRLSNNKVSKAFGGLIDLPVTVRPYRAHTEALSEYYPELAVDFGRQSIQHLLEDGSWPLQTVELRRATEVERLAIQKARKAGHNHTQPLRLVRNRASGDRRKIVEKEYMSVIIQDLVRVMAEMIEQQPAHLFGYILFLELVFFPKHPHCYYAGNSRNLKKLKA